MPMWKIHGVAFDCLDLSDQNPKRFRSSFSSTGDELMCERVWRSSFCCNRQNKAQSVRADSLHQKWCVLRSGAAAVCLFGCVRSSISSTHTNSHMKTHVRKKDALSRMHAHICALKCTADTQSLLARPPLWKTRPPTWRATIARISGQMVTSQQWRPITSWAEQDLILLTEPSDCVRKSTRQQNKLICAAWDTRNETRIRFNTGK